MERRGSVPKSRVYLPKCDDKYVSDTNFVSSPRGQTERSAGTSCNRIPLLPLRSPVATPGSAAAGYEASPTFASLQARCFSRARSVTHRAARPQSVGAGFGLKREILMNELSPREKAMGSFTKRTFRFQVSCIARNVINVQRVRQCSTPGVKRAPNRARFGDMLRGPPSAEKPTPSRPPLSMGEELKDQVNAILTKHNVKSSLFER